MKYWRLCAVAAAAALSVFVTSCEFSAKAITFDSAAPGTLPSGWRPVLSRWAVVRDGTAPSRPNVLARLWPTQRSSVFPLAVFESQDITDGAVSVKFKPVSGREDQAGGLVWRYRDPGNYYLARAHALRNDVAVYKLVNGVRIPLPPRGKTGGAAIERSVPSHAWSTLKVKFRGERFTVYFNHKELFQVEDPTFQGPGKVGLLTEADSITYFDDFRAEARR